MAITNRYTVRPHTHGDIQSLIALMEALPEWFNADGVRLFALDVMYEHGFVACDEEGIIRGFLSYYVYLGAAYIAWMGVERAWHRRGIGRHLLSALEEEMLQHGITELRVETLGDGVDYAPYTQTRAFYRGVGFVDWKYERQDDPNWPDKLTLCKMLLLP